ncbi:MAG: type II secretion system protein [Bacilli bacterium]|nr:type II secretion system protein [Bacilli bacterium]
MNSKGFTLIELLAMMVVLGILMTVAVPNITGILNNQKANSIVEDAVRMTDKVKTIVATDEGIANPGVNDCLIFTLDYLDMSKEIEKGPNGGDYDRKQSFVVVTRIANQYKYYARIIEEDHGKYYGINLSSLDDINKNGNSLVTDLPSSEFNAIKYNSIPNTIVTCNNKDIRDYTY